MLPPSDDDLQSLASSVARHLAGAGQRLVTAESCTGGWIAKVCTDLPGSSRWFLGGVVAYANESKQRLLDVGALLLQEHGAVSEPVVRAMVMGALQHFGADCAVAVSGVAGPDGGTPEKPVGTVWLAWAWRRPAGDKVESNQFHFAGDRESVRRHTVQRALQRLLES